MLGGPLSAVSLRFSQLLRALRDLVDLIGLGNVEFKDGDALALSWREFDGFYFFNSFGGIESDAASEIHDGVPSRARFGRELLRVMGVAEADVTEVDDSA